MSLVLQQRVENLEVDKRILHPLLTLLAQVVLLGSGHQNTIASEFTLDAVTEADSQPSDDIIRWLRSLPTEPAPSPADWLPEEDVEMPEAGEEHEELARGSPEMEEEPDVRTDAPRAHPLDLNTLLPLPVKEETPERVQMGLTRAQYESHKLGVSLGRKEQKRAERRAAEAELVRKEEEAVARRKAEQAAIDANIAAMLARKAELDWPPKVKPEEPVLPSGPLPDVDGCCLVDGIYEIINDDKSITSGSGTQPEEDKSESAPENITDT
jgi:hypothetical protein